MPIHLDLVKERSQRIERTLADSPGDDDRD